MLYLAFIGCCVKTVFVTISTEYINTICPNKKIVYNDFEKYANGRSYFILFVISWVPLINNFQQVVILMVLGTVFQLYILPNWS